MEVTVLLVVHNCEMYVEECIQSILCQSYKEFELLIVNDGSTDNTSTKIKLFKDQRIRLIDNPHNDYITSLNMGLKEAKGKYIARIDGDDLMLPERLEKQVEVMNNQIEIVVCSSWLQRFGLSDEVMENYSGLVDHPLIEMLKYNIIAHPTVMLRKSFLEEHNLSYKNYKYAEDYKLWIDIAICGGKIWVMPEILLKYRCSSDQISYQKQEQQSETTFLVQNEILNYLIEYYSHNDESIVYLYEQLLSFNERDELSANLILNVFYEIFCRKSLNH